MSSTLTASATTQEVVAELRARSSFMFVSHVKPDGDTLNVNAFAKALETARLTTPMGVMSMRAADHQVLLPIVVSTVSKDAKYKVDGTDMGFKPVKLFSAEEASTPAQESCKMQRPG